MEGFNNAFNLNRRFMVKDLDIRIRDQICQMLNEKTVVEEDLEISGTFSKVELNVLLIFHLSRQTVVT